MNQDGEDIRCEIMWKLNEEKKFDEIVEHTLSGCMNCLTNLKKRFNGHEMLFPGALPPWIKVPESEQKNPASWKKYEKKKVSVQMTAEEFEQFLTDSDLGDEAMIFEIVKFMRIERMAAWSKLHAIRKKQKEIRIQKEKEQKLREKKESEAKRDAEKLKKSDEKRKVMEAKKQKEEEKAEYLEKMNEEEKMLEAVIGGGGGEGGKESEEAEEAEDEEEEKQPKHTKEFNVKNRMPWLPSSFDMLCIGKRSAVDQDEQKRMIAMCQNLMNHGSYQHPSNRKELKDIRKASEGEYEALVAGALEHANKETCHPIDYVVDQIFKNCLAAFHRKSPPSASFLFKTPLITINIRSCEGMDGLKSEKQAQMPILERIVKKSSGNDILKVPDITKKCAIIRNKNLRKSNVILKMDEVAKRILETTSSVSVVMDATTACHLLTPNWESRDYEFGIPIEVNEVFVNGLPKKVVVLGKPNPYSMITKSSMQRMVLKRFLKNQFVENKIKISKFAQKPADNQSSETAEPAEEKEATSSSKNSDSPGFLDDLFAEMDKTSKNFARKDAIPPEFAIETGYQYSIFQCGQQKVLIRSHPPYQIQELSDKKRSVLENKNVSFEPRIEYLPNGGAMDLCPAEWVWNYTKQLLKHTDAHILYRTSYKLDNVLQIDAVTMKIDVCEPPPSALALLSTRSLMLEELIARLEQLEAGEYLAYQESNKPLVVLAKSEDPGQGVNTDVLRIKEDDVKSQASTIGDDFFHGFSPEVALQWQVVQGRAPRLLMATDSPMNEFVPSRNSVDKLQRKKHGIKRKFDRIEKSQENRHKGIDLDDPNLYTDFTNPAMLNAATRNSGGGRGSHHHRGRGGRGGRRGRGRGNGGGRGGRGNWRGRGGGGAASEPSSAPSTSS